MQESKNAEVGIDLGVSFWTWQVSLPDMCLNRELWWVFQMSLDRA